ncbi:MAG: hypothetical protein QME51_10780, partial [Planctomycetota bacterium]|nr:hypothetical protein [Planctomycetota bacterium]
MPETPLPKGSNNTIPSPSRFIGTEINLTKSIEGDPQGHLLGEKKNSLKGRDLLSINDLSAEEIEAILDTAAVLKRKSRLNKTSSALKGKVLAMLFQKPSTRTRVSFEVAMYQLGGQALYLSANELQLKRGETIADTARVLCRYVDVITARVYSHNDVTELAKYSTVPVINALSDYEHPCQALADIFTILE